VHAHIHVDNTFESFLQVAAADEVETSSDNKDADDLQAQQHAAEKQVPVMLMCIRLCWVWVMSTCSEMKRQKEGRVRYWEGGACNISIFTDRLCTQV